MCIWQGLGFVTYLSEQGENNKTSVLVLYHVQTHCVPVCTDFVRRTIVAQWFCVEVAIVVSVHRMYNCT